jgi:hypothetical protein
MATALRVLKALSIGGALVATLVLRSGRGRLEQPQNRPAPWAAAMGAPAGTWAAVGGVDTHGAGAVGAPLSVGEVAREVARVRATAAERLASTLVWHHSLREARALSERTGKPLAVFRCEGDYSTGRV